MEPTRDHGAIRAIALGAVSLFFLGVVFGAGALIEGWRSRRRIAESGGQLTGDGLARAGMVLGAIGLVGWTILLVIRVTS